jgi:GlcNAc-P-P-Und epimerase
MKKILITGGNGFIGTNLLLAIREKNVNHELAVYIVDLATPKIQLEENESWLNISILDRESLVKSFLNISPDFVIHLAAETSCDPTMKMEDYKVNTEGSENIYFACEKAKVDCLVNTSTQFVNQSDKMPAHDTDYAPHTIYGESKIVAETILRNGNYTFNWIIVRPTNIWGRWHLNYPHQFWKIVREGKYFHPGKQVVTRSYGYVGNVCDQILKLLELRNSKEVSRNVFYVGDAPINLFDWANAFCLSITNKPARVIPRPIVYALAVGGTILQKMKIKFPITLSRYESMTSNNPAPMEKTLKLLGTPKYSMQEGVDITTKWLFDFWKAK